MYLRVQECASREFSHSVTDCYKGRETFTTSGMANSMWFARVCQKKQIMNKLFNLIRYLQMMFCSYRAGNALGYLNVSPQRTRKAQDIHLLAQDCTYCMTVCNPYYALSVENGRPRAEAVNSENTTPFCFCFVFFATLCFQVTSAFGKGPKTAAAATTTGLRQRL